VTTKPDPDAEWWTTSDVAEYLGVRIGTVSSYRIRGQMPEPTKTVGRTHMWSPQTIISWNEKRSPRPPADQPVAHEFLQVSTAVESRPQAEKLVRAVVEQRLAANAQIVGPVASAFWHLGEFGMGEEWRIVLTTHLSRYSELEAYILEHHPWDNPELMAVPVVAGSDACLEWVRNSVSADQDPS
jgi:uncharacterized protein involved in tolerance to divalent cations